MFQKQAELKMAAMQFDIIFAKGFWYAWYYQVLKNDSLEEIANESTDNN